MLLRFGAPMQQQPKNFTLFFAILALLTLGKTGLAAASLSCLSSLLIPKSFLLLHPSVHGNDLKKSASMSPSELAVIAEESASTAENGYNGDTENSVAESLYPEESVGETLPLRRRKTKRLASFFRNKHFASRYSF